MSKIRQTEDYSSFKRIRGNRLINKAQVKRLYDSIGSNPSLTEATPIIVNGEMEVLDGQHRLEALKELNLPVSYLIVDDMGLEEVQQINSSTKVWTPIDYAKSFTELGNRNYKTYLEFKKRYRLSHTILITYLSGYSDNKRGNTPQSFKKGLFTVGDTDYAHQSCERLIEVGKYYTNYKQRSFALALYRAMKNPEYDHDRMISKLKSHKSMIVDYSYPEDHMRQLEKIYNHKTWGEVGRVKLF